MNVKARMINTLREYRGKLKQGSVSETVIVDELIKPLKRAKPLTDYTKPNRTAEHGNKYLEKERESQTKEGLTKEREQLEVQIEEAEANLAAERKKSEIKKTIVSLFVKATTEGSTLDFSGPDKDKKIAGYWIKINDLVESLAQYVPDEHRSQSDKRVDQFLGYLWHQIFAKELPKQSASKREEMAGKAREVWYLLSNFSSERKDNSTIDAETALSVITGQSRPRANFIRKNHAREVFYSKLDNDTENSIDSNTETLSDAELNEDTRRKRRPYHTIPDEKLKEHVWLCDKVCDEEMVREYAIRRHRIATSRMLLSKDIAVGLGLAMLDDCCEAIKDMPKDTYDDLAAIEVREAAATRLMVKIHMANTEIISDVANSSESQDAEKEIREAEDKINKLVQDNSTTSGATYLSSGAERVVTFTKTAASIAALAALGF